MPASILSTESTIVKNYILFLPSSSKPSLSISHYISKIIALLKNYLNFNPNNCLQNKDFGLGEHIENFLYQNSVSEINIHIKVKDETK